MAVLAFAVACSQRRLAQVQTSGELKSLSIVQALAGAGDDLLVGLDVSTPAVLKFGTIAGEVGGLAVYRDDSGRALLLVPNAGNDSFHLDELEGVGLYYGSHGSGYLLLSSQGNDSDAVFERNGDNVYLGSFSVVANAALDLDGASETDGLDVISTPLGDRFPYGLFVAQGGRNLMPPENQNYKVVSWEAIADVLKLQTYTGWNPRRAVLRH